jgi:hypothetical protein
VTGCYVRYPTRQEECNAASTVSLVLVIKIWVELGYSLIGPTSAARLEVLEVERCQVDREQEMHAKNIGVQKDQVLDPGPETLGIRTRPKEMELNLHC